MCLCQQPTLASVRHMLFLKLYFCRRVIWAIQNRTVSPGSIEQNESLAIREQDADFILQEVLKMMIPTPLTFTILIKFLENLFQNNLHGFHYLILYISNYLATIITKTCNNNTESTSFELYSKLFLSGPPYVIELILWSCIDHTKYAQWWAKQLWSLLSLLHFLGN